MDYCQGCKIEDGTNVQAEYFAKWENKALEIEKQFLCPGHLEIIIDDFGQDEVEAIPLPTDLESRLIQHMTGL